MGGGWGGVTDGFVYRCDSPGKKGVSGGGVGGEGPVRGWVK